MSTLAAALTAGAVVASSVALTQPGGEAAPVRSYEVMPASVVTDALYGFGDAVGETTDLLGTLAATPVWLTADALHVLGGIGQDPAAAGYLLSYLLQVAANPGYATIYGASYPWVLWQDVDDLAALLPAAVGQPVRDALRDTVYAIDTFFTSFPDPEEGRVRVQDNRYQTIPGRWLFATTVGLTRPAVILELAIDWLADLPADLEATLESAIRRPGDIPGLLSNRVYTDAATLTNIAYHVVAPLFYLPEPIGNSYGPGSNFLGPGQAYRAFTDWQNRFLDALDSVLPERISPTASTLQQQAQAALPAVTDKVSAATAESIEKSETPTESAPNLEPAAQVGTEEPSETPAAQDDESPGKPRQFDGVETTLKHLKDGVKRVKSDIRKSLRAVRGAGKKSGGAESTKPSDSGAGEKSDAGTTPAGGAADPAA
jgi:hypothetical protein